jgi:hypothetical protein
MQLFHATRTVVLILSAGLCLNAQDTPGRNPQTEAKGIPPRATPADYQSHTQAGAVTIAAEFTGHSLPTPEGPLTTEDYVAVEAALFGPAGAQLRISAADFSLRVNGKKELLPSQPYGLIVSSLKDPEWVNPESSKSKPKTSMLGGGQEDSNTPPPPPKIPLAVQRAMAQRVQRASLPEGDRALPQDGLLFFKYRGKPEKLHSVELIYDGPAGKATLPLQP